MRESMIIIVEEENEKIKDYQRVLDAEFNRHGKCVAEFISKNNIPLTTTDVGDEDLTYNGYLWSKAVAILGNLALQVADIHIIIYIPLVVSNHQYEWMKRNKRLLKRESDKIRAYSYKIEENSIKETKLNEFYEEDPIESLYDELKEKNKLWNQERGNFDVSRVRN